MTDAMPKDFVLASVLFALPIGVAVALVVWIISRALAELPDEDREFKDSPPLGFRFAWWPIQWISHYLQPLLSAKRQAALRSRLRQAGLDFSISATQFTATRIVCALLVGAAAQWLLGSFGHLQAEQEVLRVGSSMQAFAVGALLGWAYPAIWLRDRLRARRRELLKALPFYLDIITLCVEAGLNLQGAVNQAVAKGPAGALRDEFQRVLRDVRAGKPRAVSLRDMAERLNEPCISHFTTAVIHAESLGMSLGPVLRAQADQRRAERFLRAEKLALEAPVKLLLPLIACIFPCTFIVLFFPIVMKFIASGL